MTITRELKQILAMEQEFKCANPPCFHRVDGDVGHAHHAIIPKSHTNYAKYKKWLDMPENLVIVCWQCHEQHGDLTGFFMRCHFWSLKIDRGYNMREWYDSIPQIARPERLDTAFYIGKKEENGNKNLYQGSEGNLGS